ncbi:hypothetical protein QEJ31_13315 [Pigmentibacter sp. JX0631]|uniref:hypothetical protein n=1 Tax=Pigmentibacter sp. JX0631 TaxID=2976982 RepID=UPI002468A336|nr:hypothetical protein [Pigmentibacter sp. JX0631]WGL59503.1 hypothetical protein QEJ31_13315 [Pigmentibacter sp. JX0631]
MGKRVWEESKFVKGRSSGEKFKSVFNKKDDRKFAKIESFNIVENDIFYANIKWNATGDLRIIGILGLYLSSLRKIKKTTRYVFIYLASGTPDWIIKFLNSCKVNTIVNDYKVKIHTVRYSEFKKKFENEIEMDNISPIYDKFSDNYMKRKIEFIKENPLDIFHFQRHMMLKEEGDIHITSLTNLDELVPIIRNEIFEESTFNNLIKGKTKILIIHTKVKAYLGKNNICDVEPGENYHEEHKLSFTLDLAIGFFAKEIFGWDVIFNDDGNRMKDKKNEIICNKKIYEKIKGIYLKNNVSIHDFIETNKKYHSKYSPKDIYDQKNFKEFILDAKHTIKGGISLFEQYALIAELGTTNVIHLGGRSGHLEFMIYLGQKVLYVEDKNADGSERIKETLCTLTYKEFDEKPLMYQLEIDPTTKGGRIERKINQVLSKNKINSDNLKLLRKFNSDDDREIYLNSLEKFVDSNPNKFKKFKEKKINYDIDQNKVFAFGKIIEKLCELHFE